MFSADLGVNQVASTPPATDPPFQKVALLLHGDGTNGAQNNTFLDSSTNNFTITRTGNVAQGTFSPFSLSDGQWSNYFDGTGDYLSVPDSTSFDFGTSDFTVECFACFSSFTSTASLISNYDGTSGSWSFQVRTDNGKIVFGSGNTQVISATFSPTIGTWYHFAVARSGTTLKIFVNGVAVASITDSTSFSGSSTSLVIGCLQNGVQYFNGYISNVRLVKGTAVYTSNFTPPTSPLTAITNTSLLTCQSNRFKDNSSNNFTITPSGDTKVTAFSPFAPSAAYSASTNGGSAYFDGSGDYLTVASNAAFAFGTGDYTVEFLMYPLSITSQRALVDIGNATWQIYSTTSGTISFYNGADRITSSALTNNQWYHVAISRASNSTKMFINGVQSGSTYTDTTNYSGPYGVGVADRFDGALSEYNGYISDLRIVKGTAVYTANFTPPTAPLTAVTNTQLLLNCTNAGIFDNAGKNDIETVGNAQISTSVKKYGTGSMYFDGTGDFLTLSANPINFLGTGDFTIEAWIYPTDSSTNKSIIGSGAVTGSFRIIVLSSTNTIRFAKGVSTAVIDSSTPCSLNTWQHTAVVRSGTTVTMYLNGVSVGTATDSYDYTVSTLNIGAYNASGSQPWYGYIDDLRITKGQALYTSNFTPPTQAFPNV